ncbi:unnamed protein product [Rhizophagus irregularis]|nr:unnamed protein product [Rhizophagus irregularis]
METLKPDKIIEWISYDRFQNIKYLTKGGCSKIYTADWVDGYYVEWNSKEKQLKRFGSHKVILKKLENIESANRSWFDEGKSHLTIKEQEVLLSKPCNFSIPNNIDDFKKSVYFKPSNKKISKLSNIFEGSKKLSVIFNKFK